MINAQMRERIEVPTVVSQEQVDFYVDNRFSGRARHAWRG